MNLQRIFPFLKRNLTQDPLLINRIFVSLYIIYNKVYTYNSFISRYIIKNEDKDYKELKEVIAYTDKLQVDKLDLEDVIK